MSDEVIQFSNFKKLYDFDITFCIIIVDISGVDIISEGGEDLKIKRHS